MYLYLADGGPMEDLGIVQLLRRRQRWILSVDVGDDPKCWLIDLRDAIALARGEGICSFFDPQDPRRDLEDVLREYTDGSAPYLHLGVLYSGPRADGRECVGDIFHTRMRLLEDAQVRGLISHSEVLPPGGAPAEAEAAAASGRLPADEEAAGQTPQQHVAMRSAPLARQCGPPSAEQEPSIAEAHRSRLEVEQQAAQTGGISSSSGSNARYRGGSPRTVDAGEVPAVPSSQLGGLCCSCCHRRMSFASAAACLCGTFPNTHTVHQFFTPLLWANFCRLGRDLTTPAILALGAAQRREAVAAVAAERENITAASAIAPR